MRTWRGIAAGLSLFAAAPALGARGSSGNTRAAPETKSAGAASERSAEPERDLPIEPRHGIFGAPGAANDAYGPSRLGAGSPRTTLPSYGERAEGEGRSYEAWQSGDRVRSPSSADVRLARRQDAPDLEFAEEQAPRQQRAATPQQRQGRTGR
jgi:hypothetical protein